MRKLLLAGIVMLTPFSAFALDATTDLLHAGVAGGTSASSGATGWGSANVAATTSANAGVTVTNGAIKSTGGSTTLTSATSKGHGTGNSAGDSTFDANGRTFQSTGNRHH